MIITIDGSLEDLKRLFQPSQSQVELVATGYTHQDIIEVLTLIRAGRPIDAIRFVRTKTSLGLKEAKDFVDQLRTFIP
jgi:ribosomal protein L7/L12